MSQLNSNASSVQTLAGDTSANIQETGQNQRFKAEMKLREQQLKLEQAKLGLEKYGIDSTRAGYAGLNQSNERIASGNNQTQLQVAQQRQAMDEKQMAAQQEQWEIQNKLDERHLQMQMEAQLADLEVERAMAAGNLESLKGLKAARSEVRKHMMSLQIAQAAATADEETFQKGFADLLETTSQMLPEFQSGEQRGIEAAQMGQLNMGRAISQGLLNLQKTGGNLKDALDPTNPNTKVDFGGIGNVALNVLTGGEAGDPFKVTTYKDGHELAGELAAHMVDGAIETIVDDPSMVGPARDQLRAVYSALMKRKAAGDAGGQVGPPDPSLDDEVKQSLYKLYQVPGVNKGAVLGLMSGIQQKFLSLSNALAQNNLEVLADPELKASLAPLLRDQGARDAMLKASKVLGSSLFGLKSAVGEHNVFSADALKEYTELLVKAANARMGPERTAALLAKSGFDPSLFNEVKGRFNVDEWLSAAESMVKNEKLAGEAGLRVAEAQDQYDYDQRINALGTGVVSNKIKERGVRRMKDMPLPSRNRE